VICSDGLTAHVEDDEILALQANTGRSGLRSPDRSDARSRRRRQRHRRGGAIRPRCHAAGLDRRDIWGNADVGHVFHRSLPLAPDEIERHLRDRPRIASGAWARFIAATPSRPGIRRHQGDAHRSRRQHDALALFRKEASALHYIHHEAIVRYYIFSNDPERAHYLAMEFVDGQPLSDLLQRGPLGFEAVRLLQERLAAGLNAAHQHASSTAISRPTTFSSREAIWLRPRSLISHCAIHPGRRRHHHRQRIRGKYNYVSPEQLGLFGGDVTAKSDIYSLVSCWRNV